MLIAVSVEDSLGNHLNNLLRDAENHFQDLSGIDDVPQPPYSTRSSFSSIIGESVTVGDACALFLCYIRNKQKFSISLWSLY